MDKIERETEFLRNPIKSNNADILSLAISIPAVKILIGYKPHNAVAHFRSCINDSASGPAWYKYFLCGVKGAMEIIPTESVPTGILAAVSGNIPPNSGLSSSSALVSAALLSIVHASQVFISRRMLNIIKLLALYTILQSNINYQFYFIKKINFIKKIKLIISLIL